MTTAIIYKNNDRLSGLSVSGHTGFSTSGYDILCASISSIVQTAGLGIKKLVCENITLVCNEKIPEFKILLPETLSDSQYLQAKLILDTCIIGIKDLQSGYPNYIKVEVKNNVY